MNKKLKKILTKILIDQISIDIKQENPLPLSEMIGKLLEEEKGLEILMSYLPE